MTVMRLSHAILLLILLTSGAGVWAQSYHPGIAARVNGVELSNERFDAFYREYRRPYGINVAGRGDHLHRLTKLRQEAMDLMIEQELIRQAAERKGIKVEDGEVDEAFAVLSEPFDKPGDFIRRLETEGYTEASYREHLRRMLAAKKYLDTIRAEASNVSDEELEAYYRDNEVRLTLPEQVRVRHILLSWKPLGKPDDKAALYEQMQAILEKARAGEDFAELAREYSDDSTRMNGGDVGFFYRGQMLPAFEAAAFALPPGEISDIVETNYGLHILRLEERKEAQLLPLDEVRDQLREHISEEKVAVAEEQEIARLKQEGKVEILILLKRPEQG